MRRKLKFIKHFFGLFWILLLTFLLVRAWVLRPQIDLEPLFTEETFELPLHITDIPSANWLPSKKQLFTVTEKEGRIKWLEQGALKASGLILDIKAKVVSDSWEEGLLSVAFDPSFATNHYIYTFYNHGKPLYSRITRFTLGDDLKADLSSEIVILEFPKLHTGHNGGQLSFGSDGYLWISVGEGGSVAKKKFEQLDGRSFLGTILRIDVKDGTLKKPYRVPIDNPFVGNSEKRPEIWALGFRNPWRFSFLPDGRVILGDVGHVTREEINIIEKGGHYGWPFMEGELCYPPERNIINCEQKKFKAPTKTFIKSVSRSITGGLIYRGNKLEFLNGHYVFADYLRGILSINISVGPSLVDRIFMGQISLLSFKTPTLTGKQRGKGIHIVSFFEDKDKEILAVDLQGGIYKVIPLSFLQFVKGYLYQVVNFK